MPRVPLIVFLIALVWSPAQSQSLPSQDNLATIGTVPNAAAPDPSPEIATTSRNPLSFGAVVRELGRNFRDLPSLETGFILGTAGGLSAWVRSEDAEITHHWAASTVLDDVFEPGAILGGGWVQIGGAFGTYIVGRATDNDRTALLGSDLIRAQAINTVLTQGLKVAVHRQRPNGTQFSFPSGHTSATFATATVLQRRLGWKVGAPAYAVAAFVGGSRLQENRHYPSDVIFGAGIGIVSGRTATIGHGSTTFEVSPLAAPGTVGVEVIHRSHR